jgi:hypothetical protein
MSLSHSPFRTPVVAVIGGLITAMASANPIETYRDKNRLILLSLPTAAAAQQTSATLADFRAQIEERHVKVIDLSPHATHIPQTVRMTAEQTAQLRKEFRLATDETRAIFLLIGKDGGEKARQSGALDLKQWCALIDQMPMRRQEMKQQQR